MSSPPPGTPPEAEVDIPVRLVGELLESQHADLADRPLHLVAEGWDNVTYRLGPDLAVRLPRRSLAAGLIVNEQRWLPLLAERLTVAIPAPVRCGAPSATYPWPWSVVPWIEGAPAFATPLRPDQASRLGEVLALLHATEVPTEPPQNPFRGRPLETRMEVYEHRMRLVAPVLGATAAGEARRIFGDGASSAIDVAPTWLHGDLHSKNVLTVDGVLSGIIDWGDICTGDPATDLATAWILFEPEAHEEFWRAYGSASAPTRRRAAAWAIAFGLMLWDSHHVAEPEFAEVGLLTIRRVAATS